MTGDCSQFHDLAPEITVDALRDQLAEVIAHLRVAQAAWGETLALVETLLPTEGRA